MLSRYFLRDWVHSILQAAEPRNILSPCLSRLSSHTRTLFCRDGGSGLSVSTLQSVLVGSPSPTQHSDTQKGGRSQPPTPPPSTTAGTAAVRPAAVAGLICESPAAMGTQPPRDRYETGQTAGGGGGGEIQAGRLVAAAARHINTSGRHAQSK